MWSLPAVLIIALYVVVEVLVGPFLGVALARLTGPLTYPRGLFGAVLGQLVVINVVGLLLSMAADPRMPRRVYDFQIDLREQGPYTQVLGQLKSVALALVVGSVIIAIWRAIEWRRGVA